MSEQWDDAAIEANVARLKASGVEVRPCTNCGKDTTAAPEYELPSGYRVRPYCARDACIEVEHAAFCKFYDNLKKSP